MGLETRGNEPGAVGVERDLVQALITNPALRVQTENGWFDMATPFFATEFTVDHLQLPPALRAHIDFKYYDSGHMIYLNEQDLPKLKQNIADLIDAAIKPQPSAHKESDFDQIHRPPTHPGALKPHSIASRLYNAFLTRYTTRERIRSAHGARHKLDTHAHSDWNFRTSPPPGHSLGRLRERHFASPREALFPHRQIFLPHCLEVLVFHRQAHSQS